MSSDANHNYEQSPNSRQTGGQFESSDLQTALSLLTYPGLRSDLIEQARLIDSHLAAQLQTLPDIAYNSMGEVFAGLEGLRMLESVSGHEGIDPTDRMETTKAVNPLILPLLPLQAGFAIAQIWGQFGLTLYRNSLMPRGVTKH